MFLTIVFVRKNLVTTLLCGRLVNQESLPGRVHGAKADRDGTLNAPSWRGMLAA